MKNKLSINRIAIIFLLILCLLLTCVIIYQYKKIVDLNNDIKNIMIDMQNKDDIIIDDFSLPINDIDNLINNDFTGIIYFGRDSCPFCSQFNFILKNNIDISQLEIYKFDTDKWRNDTKYQFVLDKYNIENIPALVKITDDHSIVNYIPKENATNEEVVDSLEKFLFDN